MKTLATMGMGAWQENYADTEQYYNSTQTSAARALGSGVGVRDDTAIALHRARIRGGAGAFEQMQKAQATLAGTPLGDISGSALTGVGFSALTSYAAGPLGKMGAALFGVNAGALETGLLSAAPAIGLGVGALALGYNRVSAAMSQQAPMQLAQRQLETQQAQGFFAKTWAGIKQNWQEWPMRVFNPEAVKEGTRLGQAATIFAEGKEINQGIFSVDWILSNYSR